MTIRDLGYSPGSLSTGPTNSLLDVPGVHVGQVTVPTKQNLVAGSTATKGVTVICPRAPKDFWKPCRAGRFVFNGNGEVTGSGQVEDWGYTNTPISITNSLGLGSVIDATWHWIMGQQDKLNWDTLARSRHYGTPVVGETSDWLVNSETRHTALLMDDVRTAFANLKSLETGGFVQEGQHGGGAGMTCHGHAAGTGTASRVIGGTEHDSGKYTLGVLCQSNYGHIDALQIGGVPVGKILEKEGHSGILHEGTEPGGRTEDGSIVIIIVTDAPMSSTQLRRLARHATAGLALVGGHAIGSNFSGDIFLALSTHEYGSEQVDVPLTAGLRPTQTYGTEVVKNESLEGLFQACAEATEEAILNSLVGGRWGTVGMDGRKIAGLPVERVRELIGRYCVKV
ncbi:hypothetical protein LTR62_005481 [Meristemomyces frigidus]|uniref:Uncharacterized protein n=1 Tax=Meristemomyces frigidus TaxID=1508187 RepID=A0AAN7YJB1_9PEZI|nr:hypothetical protein LTR62_005481 [Meristemomyces frigidus]